MQVPVLQSRSAPEVVPPVLALTDAPEAASPTMSGMFGSPADAFPQEASTPSETSPPSASRVPTIPKAWGQLQGGRVPHIARKQSSPSPKSVQGTPGESPAAIPTPKSAVSTPGARPGGSPVTGRKRTFSGVDIAAITARAEAKVAKQMANVKDEHLLQPPVLIPSGPMARGFGVSMAGFFGPQVPNVTVHYYAP
jgi:hypothetical protein